MSKAASSHKARAQMSSKDFADPKNRKFPIKDSSDVKDAARLVGHASNPAKVKARIKTIASRKGLTAALPKTWKKKKKKS